MSGQEAKKTDYTPLLTMLGGGDFFVVKDDDGNEKRYKVKPIKLRELNEFFEDQIVFGGSQIFNIATPERKEKLDKWLLRQVSDMKDNPVTLQRVMDEGWNIKDLRVCLAKILDISG